MSNHAEIDFAQQSPTTGESDSAAVEGKTQSQPELTTAKLQQAGITDAIATLGRTTVAGHVPEVDWNNLSNIFADLDPKRNTVDQAGLSAKLSYSMPEAARAENLKMANALPVDKAGNQTFVYPSDGTQVTLFQDKKSGMVTYPLDKETDTQTIVRFGTNAQESYAVSRRTLADGSQLYKYNNGGLVCENKDQGYGRSSSPISNDGERTLKFWGKNPEDNYTLQIQPKADGKYSIEVSELAPGARTRILPNGHVVVENNNGAAGHEFIEADKNGLKTELYFDSKHADTVNYFADGQATRNVIKRKYDDILEVSSIADPGPEFKQKVITELDQLSDTVIDAIREQHWKIQLVQSMASINRGGTEIYTDGLADRNINTIVLAKVYNQFVYDAYGRKQANGQLAERNDVPTVLHHEFGHVLANTDSEPQADIYAAIMVGRSTSGNPLERLKASYPNDYATIMDLIKQKKFARNPAGIDSPALGQTYRLAQKGSK